ncbi:hypothetical protein NE237_004555 [Protea cynaroides]|uniref:Uncharacterized protein n=1 Tax=Protea cynaroides TaxID=273540 RepID=A0A9Q0KJ57_9MAGN|nr:hypothetical protein NE237_004555 [Protea cynaroides]
MESVKKLAKKVKVIGSSRQSLHYESLPAEGNDESSAKIPPGFFALYVGEERQRFVVPTNFLSHPLFKILMDKMYDEFGFDQRNGLVVPCSVSTFQEVLDAVQCCHGQFDLGRLVE